MPGSLVGGCPELTGRFRVSTQRGAALARFPHIAAHYHRAQHWLSTDVASGVLLLATTTLALAWANSPWRQSYERLSATVVGPASLHLDLTLATWATDGLLAIFFFVVGLELKHELVAGSLRNLHQAAVPVFAAVGGMLLPAVLYIITALNWGERSLLDGWAIPTATDIAFALAVLAIFGRGLPAALRLFLLTLAVVDDLLAIIIIAVFYTESIDWPALAGALGGVLLFAALVRLGHPPTALLVILAVATWIAMHESGVHATIAGALLGFVVPAVPIAGEPISRAVRYEHAWRPVSAALALPVFAFFAAGVNVVNGQPFSELLVEPVVLAIVAALVLGKLGGVLLTTALVTRLTRLHLPDSIGMRDLLPVGFLTGIGFTISLLIAELSFGGTPHLAEAKLAVLGGSLIAAALAAVTLRWDAHQARQRDMNLDGVEDVETTTI